MQKRFICFLCLLSLLFSLSGCGKTVGAKPAQRPTQSTAAEPVTTEPPTEPVPVTTLPPEPEKFRFPSERYPSAGMQLYRLDALDRDGFYSQVCLDDRYLALQYSVNYENASVVLFDLLENRLVLEMPLCSTGSLLALDAAREHLIVNNFGTPSRLELYDFSGALVHSYAASDELYRLYMDEDGRLWDIQGRNLFCVDGEQTHLYENAVEGDNPQIFSVQGDIVQYVTSESFSAAYRYDCATQTLSYTPELDGFHSINSRVLYRAEDDALILATPDGVRHTLPFGLGETYLIAQDGDYTAVLSDCNLYRADLTRSTLERYAIGSNEYYGVACDEGNVAFAVLDGAAASVLYCPAVEEAPAAEFSAARLDDATLENCRKSAALFSRYGIRPSPFSPKEGNSLGGFLLSEVSSEDIAAYLRDLETYLSRYPDHFFDQIKNDLYSALAVYYTMALLPEDTSSIGNASAVTTSGWQTIQIAFSGGFGFAETDFSHELWHALEYYVVCEDDGSLSYITGWDALNPEDFSYNNAYTDENGDTLYSDEYTYWNEDDPERIWFIDYYARLYAKEDRARIFENMCVADGFDYFAAPHLRAKAQYLTDLLRTIFPEIDPRPWEDWLNR